MKISEYSQMMKHLTRPMEQPSMANGGSTIPIGPRAMVGEITDEQTKFGSPVYKTPEGERVSEKSVTLFFNGKWMNVPSIHGGKSFNEAELRRMIKLGNIEPTSVHKSKYEAETAAKERSASMADGGRIGFKRGKKALPKNIRLTPGGQYRFGSEASGEFFSKTFKTLKEAVKFRDDYLADLKEKGLLRKEANPKRGKYESVKGQKHIKFNGVTYQVNIQRGDEGAQYFSSLKDAIKERDTLVKKYPAKTMTEYNIKEKPKQVNAEILELSKNPTIKNIFKTGVLTDKAITEAANILKVDKATAINRLENLATAYSGDRKNVPGIKPAFIENARKIAAELPGAKTKAAELATGVPFEGESIKVPKQEIGRDAKYPTDLFDIDEARATATGLKRGTSPWSIFGQMIDKNVNRIAKGGFGGAGWDSRAGTLERELDDAVKNFGPDSKEAKAAMTKYNKEATKFENEFNSKKLRGAKRVRIPRISLDAPSKTIANWANFNKKYKDVFNENFKTKRYGFVIPKDLKTIPELRKEVLNPKSSTYKTMINLLKEGFNEYDEKKLFQKINQMTPDAVKKILRLIPRIAQVDDFETNRFASADNIMTSGVQYVDDVEEGNFITRNPYTTAGATVGAMLPFKTGRKILGNTLSAAGLPLSVALNTAIGIDPTSAVDRTILAGEAALAPSMIKDAIRVTDKIKNPLLRKVAQGITTINPKYALKAASRLSPIGIASLAGEGLYQLGKLGYEDQKRFEALSPEEQAAERAEQEAFAFDITGT